jgi:hypothetical protein
MPTPAPWLKSIHLANGRFAFVTVNVSDMRINFFACTFSRTLFDHY